MTEKPRKPEATPQGEPAGPSLEAPWSGRAPVIIVPLDGSVEANAALPVARLIAPILKASIHLVYAAEQPLPQEELLQRMSLPREEAHGTVITQAIGTPANAIVRLAKKLSAMLIVMTTRGRTAYSGRIFRPVVDQIVHDAPCPMMLVRPEIVQRVSAMKALRRIVLPLDGTPSSAAVIGPALDLAEKSGAEVDILYVATRGPSPRERGTLVAPFYMDQPQYEWPAWAREFISRFSTSLGEFPPPTPLRLFLRSGEPAKEILRLAAERDGDLIVLEWRGRLDPAHANTVRGVLIDAPCPVLLLRTRSRPFRG